MIGIFIQLMIGLLVIDLIYLFKGKHNSKRPEIRQRREAPNDASSMLIGCKTAWLAIHEDSPSLVIAALGLTNPTLVTWNNGMDEAGTHGRVFVTQDRNGWILVIGVPDLFYHKKYEEFVSKRFREVQYFITHRVIGYHGWAKYVDCELVRRYCWSGESGQVLCNDGDLTPEELALGFDRFPQSDDEDWEHVRFPDEEDVHQIAAAWSGSPDGSACSHASGGFLCTISFQP